MSYVEEVRVDVAVPAGFARAVLLDIDNWADLLPEYARSAKRPTYAWAGPPWRLGSCIVATVGAGLSQITNRQTVMPVQSGELYRIHGNFLGIEAVTTCSVEDLDGVSSRIVRTTTSQGWLSWLANRMPSKVEEETRRTEARIKAAIEDAWRSVSGVR